MEQTIDKFSQAMMFFSAHRSLGAFAIITGAAVLAMIAGAAFPPVLRFVAARIGVTLEDATLVSIRHPLRAVVFLGGCWVALAVATPVARFGFFFSALARSALILLIAYYLNRIMKSGCKSWCAARPVWAEHIYFLENFGRVGLFIVCMMILLRIWRVDTTPFLASAGIVSISIAIAAKDTVANLFGGINLFLDKPFVRGDYIVLDSGERGQVIDIGLRSTLVRTRDDEQVSIPNAIMSTTRVINESAPVPRFRIHIRVGVAFGSDIDGVEAALLEVARANPSLADTPAPRVRFRRFGESSLIFELLCWAKDPADRGRIIHELNRAIYLAFAQHDIRIPFPQRDIHMHPLAPGT